MYRFIDWLILWLIDWLSDWLIDFLIDWLIDWLNFFYWSRFWVFLFLFSVASPAAALTPKSMSSLSERKIDRHGSTIKSPERPELKTGRGRESDHHRKKSDTTSPTSSRYDRPASTSITPPRPAEPFSGAKRDNLKSPERPAGNNSFFFLLLIEKLTCPPPPGNRQRGLAFFPREIDKGAWLFPPGKSTKFLDFFLCRSKISGEIQFGLVANLEIWSETRRHHEDETAGR